MEVGWRSPQGPSGDSSHISVPASDMGPGPSLQHSPHMRPMGNKPCLLQNHEGSWERTSNPNQFRRKPGEASAQDRFPSQPHLDTYLVCMALGRHIKAMFSLGSGLLG